VSVENTAYFVTTCTAGARPIFEDWACAQVVVDALWWLGRAGRIWVLGYVVMPDYVHLAFVLREGATLSAVVKVFKGFVSRRLRAEQRWTGQIWQAAFFDRAVRDRRYAHTVLDYVHENPVRKGLCAVPEQYPFSSANPPVSRRMDWWWLE